MRSVHATALVGSVVLGILANPARATDVPIAGRKLVVVDKVATGDRAKMVFIAKDPLITKGAGTDPTQIEATFAVAYDAASGTFAMPQGANWLVNSSATGKYLNQSAPMGGAVRVSVLKPARVVKVVAKSLGESSIDISTAPTGAVYTVDSIVNGGETTRLCSKFTECVHRVVAGGAGYKLTCKRNGGGDPLCLAADPDPCLTNRFVDQGATILDACTGLEWEKKTTAVGSGVNALDPHDVDNDYRWAGFCGMALSKSCQPNLAAETACKAQTDASHWGDGCEQCTGGEGTCVVAPAVGTVWDWVSQLNAAVFAGHDDWRLPSESSCNTCQSSFPLEMCTECSTFSGHELETIGLFAYPCGTSPCIEPIFGPTFPYNYWSSSTVENSPTAAFFVAFNVGGVGPGNKRNSGFYVRAVRDAS